MPSSTRASSKGRGSRKSSNRSSRKSSVRKSSIRKSPTRNSSVTTKEPTIYKVKEEPTSKVVKKETTDPNVIVLEVPEKVSMSYGDIIAIDSHDRTSPLGREGDVKPHTRRNGSRGLSVEAKRQLAKERRKALKEGKKIEVDPDLLPPIPCTPEQKTVVGYYRYDSKGNRYIVKGYCRDSCPAPKPSKYVVKQEQEQDDVPPLERIDEDIYQVRMEQKALTNKIRVKLEEQNRELTELERAKQLYSNRWYV